MDAPPPAELYRPVNPGDDSALARYETTHGRIPDGTSITFTRPDGTRARYTRTPDGIQPTPTAGNATMPDTPETQGLDGYDDEDLEHEKRNIGEMQEIAEDDGDTERARRLQSEYDDFIAEQQRRAENGATMPNTSDKPPLAASAGMAVVGHATGVPLGAMTTAASAGSNTTTTGGAGMSDIGNAKQKTANAVDKIDEAQKLLADAAQDSSQQGFQDAIGGLQQAAQSAQEAADAL